MLNHMYEIYDNARYVTWTSYSIFSKNGHFDPSNPKFIFDYLWHRCVSMSLMVMQIQHEGVIAF